ncbi:MAG TPA: hypothetical protein VNN73_17550 [Blastocatellia bacterium]|nr:hypothetical protein [Blastocatellia bacterium]
MAIRISQIVAEATRSPVAKARISQIVAEASIKVATSVLPTVQVVIID